LTWQRPDGEGGWARRIRDRSWDSWSNFSVRLGRLYLFEILALGLPIELKIDRLNILLYSTLKAMFFDRWKNHGQQISKRPVAVC
jgi:hypothetical protein